MHKFNHLINIYNKTFTYLVYNSSKFAILTQNFLLLYSSYYILYPNYNINFHYCVSVKSTPHSNISFNEWLAGIIDGDGYFVNIHNKYPSLTIDMERKNLSLLESIYNQVGGILMTDIKNRPNVVRLTIRKRANMIDVVNRINGNIRNSVRVPQFKMVCSTLNIPFISPIPLTIDNAWFTGYFDSDGTIIGTFNSPIGLRIHITNKYHHDLECLVPIFNGKVYTVSSKNGDIYAHRWLITTKSDILAMHTYFSLYPPRSHKISRINMIVEYYELYSNGAHKKSSPHHEKWLTLAHRWKTEF